ncbi:unnamed protein product [Xylocopa violacea]|uniref:G-protein coupled receptors family 1 profile domain-containing protein n=1 Tax=Xylocopa violacea TaxID=135666 RepID=A0ABP1NWR6_XYLVO
MYSVTLNTCAFILLLSSIITILILLRKQYKQWKNTPLYILSISDALFSMFTSSILFINCMEQITYTNSNEMNNTYSITDSMENLENDNENQLIKFGKFKDFNTTENPNNFNTISKCDVISMIIRYGILFFPFTNSFVSLLMFSVQCNLNVFNLKDQCFKLLQSDRNIYEEDIDTNKSNIEIQFDSVVNLLKHKNTSMIKQNVKKILQVFKYNSTKKNKTIIAMFVLSQWIVPIFITGFLYLANYEANSIKDIENTKCLIKNIFFLDNCYIKTVHFSQNINSDMYDTPLYKDYIGNKELVKLKNSNNTQVNEIISKVQNLIYSIMNDTSTIPLNIISHNISEVQDVTKYMELDTYTKILDKHKNIEDTNSNDTVSVEKNTDFDSNVQLSNCTDIDNEESLLFNYLMINSSKDILQEENSTKKIIEGATEKLNFKESQISVTENQSITNGVIINATKHIQNIPVYQTLQNNYKNKTHYNKKPPRKFKSKQDFQQNLTLNKQNVLSNIAVNYQKIDALQKVHLDETDKCFISIQYLKLHLLVLVFVIYFLPILFSSILQRQGKLGCLITLEKLKASNEMQLNNFNLRKMNDMRYNISEDSRGSSISEQNFRYPNENQESINSNRMDLVETHQENVNKKLDKQCKNNEHYNIQFDKTKMELNIVNKLENMVKLFNAIKMSLLFGILLWTPLFFAFLIEIFISLHVPDWFLNITYLVAIAFSVIRNIFNLKTIKFQENNIGTITTNRIHPII